VHAAPLALAGQLPVATPAVIPEAAVVMAGHAMSLQHLVWSTLALSTLPLDKPTAQVVPVQTVSALSVS
jgi:hypothetical protein